MASEKLSPQIEVAIVGAGVSGLAVANGLMNDPHNRFNITVYERDSVAFDSERGGYQLRISSNGIHALRKVCDAKTWSALQDRWGNDQAKAPAMVDPSTFNIVLHLSGLMLYPQSRPIARKGLRWTLLQKPMNEGRIMFQHYLHSFEYLSGGGVELHFEDQASRRADILIAADGSSSRINRQIGLNNKVKMKAWTSIQGQGLIDKSTAREKLPKTLNEIGSVIHMAGDKIAGFASIYDAASGEATSKKSAASSVFWSVLVPNAVGGKIIDRSGGSVSDEDVIDRLLEYLGHDLGFTEALPSVRSASRWALRAGLVTSSFKPEGDWRGGDREKFRVIVLGDALHPMTPGRRMGANTALTDAGNLVDVLKSATFPPDKPLDDDLASIVKPFDAEMYTRAFKMV
ncbi:related to flavo monooxygenase [Lecanosticta acicola]|uniref:Related to flavo monooxygenase n=1 Tax=Lecanosticta acicola TaxID=111012 RepID=A0AAI9E726_9PEZI|nr:related to flavo monooxygenase [Lecanosticta acicola]